MLRPVLALPVVGRLRVLAHPLVALPLWAANLYLWHLPVLYEAALRHDALHALEHACFFGFGVLMWAAVVEVVPGPAWFGTGWKLGYVVVVRLLETVLGNVFFWSGEPVYGTYARAERIWGIGPLADQGFAGGIMMVEGSLVTIAALAWLFLRLAKEGELRQELLERGLDRALGRSCRPLRARAGVVAGPLNGRAWWPRRSRRPLRLLGRAQPRLLPRAPRAARLPPRRGDRGRARRDGLVPRRPGDAVGIRESQTPDGVDRYRVGLHHLAFRAVARRGRRARRLAPRARGRDRERAGGVRRTRPATTPCSSPTPTGSSSRSSTTPRRHACPPRRSPVRPSRRRREPVHAADRMGPPPQRRARRRILALIGDSARWIADTLGRATGCSSSSYVVAYPQPLFAEVLLGGPATV